ncbi:LytTR family DNA-binding domain-containing protein [Lactobacillus sp. LL6]|uniref:LytR/AlgR family response regulator transcription factor n=1 Tax=Lactobacillus sp. LL6 TaxID=2596827 RepID=UPI001184F371|nr:LytTR family DNA-binding domain-containing protein [Lactobacillus sp. LL6]TSO26768.1 response regulator transcription factor [Lactobacillus sp. LL6]
MIQKIIICDDDEFTLKIEQNYLSTIIKNKQLNFEIVACLRNYKELSTFLENTSESFIYFMDLDFGDNHFNGVDISHYVRQYDENAKIIFVTSHSEEVFQVLKSGVEPFGFIEKTINQQKMLEEFEHYLLLIEKANAQIRSTSASKSSNGLQIPIGIDEYVFLPFEKITYIETALEKAHHIYFHTIDNSQLIIRWSLTKVAEKLPDNFIRCHRSTIVNKDYIVNMNHGDLRLSSGDTIPYSRKYTKILKEVLNNA